jgi:hypothetical protein
MSISEWIKEVLNYGLAGLVIIGFVSGWIVPKPTHQREVERADEAHKLLKMQSELLDRLTRSLHPP